MRGGGTYQNGPLLVAAAVLAWCLSLFLPALSMVFDPANGHIRLRGYQLLTAGWIDIAALQFGWIANPALAFSLLALAGRITDVRWARGSAIVLALATIDTLDLQLRPAFYGQPKLYEGYFVWALNNLAVAAAVLWSPSSHREVA